MKYREAENVFTKISALSCLQNQFSELSFSISKEIPYRSGTSAEEALLPPHAVGKLLLKTISSRLWRLQFAEVLS